MLYRPMPLVRVPEPFDHPEWVFELKHHGVRALAHIRAHRCEFVSRRGHVYKSSNLLAEELAHAVRRWMRFWMVRSALKRQLKAANKNSSPPVSATFAKDPL